MENSALDNYKNQENCTLVVDAGMGNWSVFFKPLARLLQPYVPVCLVDRAGYAKGPIPATKRLSTHMALEMNAILENKGVNGNIILAGHSLGGLNARMFYNLFPEKVKGLILLDAAHPFLLDKMPAVKNNIDLQIKQIKKILLMARLGILRFGKRKVPTFGLPDYLLDEYYSITLHSRYYRIYKMELESFEENLELCKQLPSLGATPLLVMGSRKGLNHSINTLEKEDDYTDLSWLELQSDLTELSSRSGFVLSTKDHFFHVTDTNFVADSILKFCIPLLNKAHTFF